MKKNTQMISRQQWATKLGISGSRARQLLEAGRVKGAQCLPGAGWIIPDNAPDPRKPKGYPKGKKRNENAPSHAKEKMV